jgi:hypothetical protein
MIPLPSGVRVWLTTGHTDMRKGFAALSLLVQEVRSIRCKSLQTFQQCRHGHEGSPDPERSGPSETLLYGNDLDLLAVDRCVLHKPERDARLKKDYTSSFEPDWLQTDWGGLVRVAKARARAIPTNSRYRIDKAPSVFGSPSSFRSLHRYIVSL